MKIVYYLLIFVGGLICVSLIRVTRGSPKVILSLSLLIASIICVFVIAPLLAPRSFPWPFMLSPFLAGSSALLMHRFMREERKSVNKDGQTLISFVKLIAVLTTLLLFAVFLMGLVGVLFGPAKP